MSEQRKSKYTKIGEIQRCKAPYDKNVDGSDKISIKINSTVTLREGEYLTCFPATEWTKADGTIVQPPEYVLFNISRKNQVNE